jgi:hypothetical protein
MDPVARARAIAARLAASAIPSDGLGKRKSRWEVRATTRKSDWRIGSLTWCVCAVAGW